MLFLKICEIKHPSEAHIRPDSVGIRYLEGFTIGETQREDGKFFDSRE